MMTEEGESLAVEVQPVGKREISSTWRISFKPIISKQMLTLTINMPELDGKGIS